MDNHLREIRLDVWEAPGRRIESLQLDKMFERVLAWSEAHRPVSAPGPSIPRPPSPSRKAAKPVYPLPKPLPVEGAVSPLGKLFSYPELVPLVLRHFERPAELAVLSRVNAEFERLCRRKLYASIWVRPCRYSFERDGDELIGRGGELSYQGVFHNSFEHEADVKLVLLLQSLSGSPKLCRLVKQLGKSTIPTLLLGRTRSRADVRFFPLATRGGDRYTLDDQVEQALREMKSLESLVWTRDKSITPQIFETLVALPKLRSLEITGHSYRYYSPHLLGQMKSLEELRVMMPDSHFRDVLGVIVEDLASRPMGGLRTLGLICRLSPLIDDDLLRKMAPYLRQLRRLTLWGCTRVTKSGVRAVLDEAEGIEELSLDALPHSGLEDLYSLSNLTNLHTYSLSVSAPHRDPLYLTLQDLPRFPTPSRITSLHLTLSGARAHLPAGGVSHILSQVDSSSLRALSLLNFVISSPQLNDILKQCPALRELYISTNGRMALLESIEELGKSGLEVLHVTTPDPRWGPSFEELQRLAERMEGCMEIGNGTRVYEVHRGADGVELRRWSRAYTPGYFRVWRG